MDRSAQPNNDTHTLLADTSSETPSTSGGNRQTEIQSPISEAQNYLLRITRRHSLPASYTLNIFSNRNSESAWGEHGEIENQPSSAKPPITINAGHNSSTIVSDAATSSSTVAGGNVNRHRYGHRHTKSTVLDQPVVVKTYNPPTTPRLPSRAGMLNPAIFEEEPMKKVELPPIEAFSFDGILKAITPEVTKTLDKFSTLCESLKDDVQAEVESITQTQKEIQAQKQQADRLASQVLKSTSTRCETLNSDALALRGGAAVEELVQLTERAYNTLESVVATLLAIDQLLPPQERLAPDTSLHQSHYPRLHELLNERYHEISARFGCAIAPGKPTLLSASLHNPDYKGSGLPGRRMSSSSTMLLSPTISSNTQNSKRLSLPPYLQLRVILPNPSNGTSSSRPSSKSSQKMPSNDPAHALLGSRRQSTCALPSERLTFSFYNDDSIRMLNSNGLDSTSSGRRATGVKGFLGFLRGIGSSSSAEENRGVGAEEKLRRVLDLSQKQHDSMGKGKGKAVAPRRQ